MLVSNPPVFEKLRFWRKKQESRRTLRNAINAGKEMLERLAALNKELEELGYPVIEIGIGIHSGEAIAGNVGSINRMDYTVIGDTVNVAARIEGVTKELGQRLLISERTYAEANAVEMQKIGSVSLRGREQAISVYACPP